MARALTGPEIAYLQDERQRTDLFLAVLVPEVVFTARVNEPAGVEPDRLATITYDGGSGAGPFADVLADMTLYVGSTAGAFDRGMARVRQGNDGNWYEAGSGGAVGSVRIGETSEIEVQDDDYLTVVDEFAPRPKPLRILDDGTIYVDYEIAYVDQHQYPQPVPVLGPHACAWLGAGGTVDVLFDGSDSWAPIIPGVGYTFVWTCAGAVVVGGATATPTITFNAPGTYRVSCAVTADYGGGNTATFTGHRRAFIFDDDNMPRVEFTLDNCSGDWRSGGWSFRVTMYDEAGLYDPATVTGIRDRTLVVLFARDWYGDTEVSLGPIQTGATTIRGNVIASGWIVGESVTMNWQAGTVGFEVQGPQHWLAQMTGFPSGLEDTDAPEAPGGDPVDWAHFNDLTVDRGLWHFLHWRSTVTRCTDVYLTGDARQTAYFDAPIGTLWEQLQQTAWNTIFAYPCCDRYARLFIEVDSQLLPTADRAGIPTVMAITPQDRRGQVDITRQTVPQTSLVDLSGIVYADGAATGLFSLAHGHVFKHYGGVKKFERVALASQAQSNILAGLHMSSDNNEYPHVDIPLRGTNRCIDICPRQYVTLSIGPGDTERGITWTDKKLVPTQVRFQMREGMMLAGIETEAYTDEVGSTDGDIPPIPPPPPSPPPPPPPPGPLPLPLPEIPGDTFIWCRTHILRTNDFDQAAPAWVDITGPIRTVGANPNYGYIASFHVNKYDGKSAWAVTCRDNLDSNDLDPNMGVWFCEDVMTPVPAWRLMLSQQAAQAFAAPANAACGIVVSNGQYRSLAITNGAIYIVEAKDPGAGNRGVSIVLVSGDNGSSWAWSPIHSGLWNFASACHICPAGSAHPGAVIIGEMTYAPQFDYKPCHAIVQDDAVVVSIAQITYDHTGWCNDQANYWYPCPYPATGCATFITAHRGNRSVARYGGLLYGVTEAGPAGQAGVLYRLPYLGFGSQPIDQGLTENFSYVPVVASPFAMYYCRGLDAATFGTYANELTQNGLTLLQSPTIFGVDGVGYNPGQIGYAMPWSRETSDGLIVVRKDHISLGALQPNKAIVGWWTAAGGFVDKTGNAHVILGANGWSGTGIRGTPGAANFSYRPDNVGAEAFG